MQRILPYLYRNTLEVLDGAGLFGARWKPAPCPCQYPVLRLDSAYTDLT